MGSVFFLVCEFFGATCRSIVVVLLYRDLKMENIMLNEKQKSIKLIGKEIANL